MPESIELPKLIKVEPEDTEKFLRAQMQERNLSALVSNKGFQFTGTFFPYTSGQIGSYYVHAESVTGSGVDYQRAVEDITQLIAFTCKGKFDFVSGGESRDWVFSYPVASHPSFHLVKPHFTIYKDGKTFGADISGKTGIHVADLSNEGSSPRDLWIPAIKKAGGNVEHIFFYVDRMEDGVEEMQKLGLHSEAVVPLDQRAWDHLRRWNVVSEDVYKQLSERGHTKEEREVWARAMLRSEKGLGRLTELLRKDSTPKIGKILLKGYPDIREEILECLKNRGVNWNIEENIVSFMSS